jgi:hypothetical protein
MPGRCCGAWRGRRVRCRRRGSGVLIFPLGILAGLLAGWARGGSLDALGRVRVRAWWLVLAGLVLHRVLPLLWSGGRAAAGLWVADALALYGALVAFALWNRRLPGAWLLLGGSAANAVAMLWAGGRMPVWTAVLARVPAATADALRRGALPMHVAMAQPGGLGWLGDVFPTPPPLPGDVFSVGDVGIALAAAVFLAGSMARRAPDPAGRPS